MRTTPVLHSVMARQGISIGPGHERGQEKWEPGFRPVARQYG